MTPVISPSMCDLLTAIRGDEMYPSERHSIALYLAVECWGRELDEQPDRGRASLTKRIKDQWKSYLRDDGYGSIAIFLLIVVASAAIEWAVGRLLDWLYPKGYSDLFRRERLCSIKGQS